MEISTADNTILIVSVSNLGNVYFTGFKGGADIIRHKENKPEEIKRLIN